GNGRMRLERNRGREERRAAARGFASAISSRAAQHAAWRSRKAIAPPLRCGPPGVARHPGNGPARAPCWGPFRAHQRFTGDGMENPARKLHDFEVTRVAAQAMCKRETVRHYFQQPDRMKAAVRARVEMALRELGFLPNGTGGER